MQMQSLAIGCSFPEQIVHSISKLIAAIVIPLWVRMMWVARVVRMVRAVRAAWGDCLVTRLDVPTSTDPTFRQ